MQKPTITIIGHTCIDHDTIDGIRYEKWGSSAMYFAKYFANEFDIKSNIISSYGHAFAKYTDEFNFFGPQGDHETLIYENIVTNGKRVQFCRNSDQSPPVEPTGEIIDLLNSTDILIAAPQISNYSPEYIDRIMNYVPESTLKMLSPQGYMRHINDLDKVEKRNFDEAEQVMKHFDVVIASDEDHDSALQIAKQWATYKDGSSVVITQAERGATVFHNGSITHIPTTPLAFSEIKNPVGSGDMFSAQFIIGLYNELHPHEAAHHAHKTTAKALVSRPFQ